MLHMYTYILTSYTCIKAAVNQKSELKAICIFRVYGNFEHLPLNIFIRILFDLR